MDGAILKDVHVGKAIEQRLITLGISKTEFAKRAEIPQQHVYRVFERDTMETKKLYKICNVLNFNFFSLFCELPTNITANLSAVNTGKRGIAKNNISDSALAVELEKEKLKNTTSESLLNMSKSMYEQSQSQLRDKDVVIAMKNEHIEFLQAEIARLKDELSNYKQ